jgi:hypothetical protein
MRQVPLQLTNWKKKPMTKNIMIAMIVAALPLVLSGQAYALTLNNCAQVELNLQIIEGDDDWEARDVIFSADRTHDVFCEEGCTIILENGVEESFDGDEVIYIESGQFIIVQ